MPILDTSEECSINRNGHKWKMLAIKYTSMDSDEQELVICLFLGTVKNNCLVRINSPCITSEAFGDEGRCDCRFQLEESFGLIERHGSGLIIYSLSEEGRGNGLFNKVNSYAIMESTGVDSGRAYELIGCDADNRSYNYAPEIANYFGLKKIKLITNNPEKLSIFSNCGIAAERIPIIIDSAELKSYIESKSREFNHILKPEKLS